MVYSRFVNNNLYIPLGLLCFGEVNDVGEKRLQKLKREVDTSIGFVAAEYKYAKDLQVQLQRLDKEPLEKADAGARKELPEKLREREEELKKKLQLTERQILRIADRYRGELQRDLRDIITEEELLKKLTERNTDKIRSELGLLFTQTKRHVDDLILWVSTMEEILLEIRGFDRELEAAA